MDFNALLDKGFAEELGDTILDLFLTIDHICLLPGLVLSNSFGGITATIYKTFNLDVLLPDKLAKLGNSSLN